MIARFKKGSYRWSLLASAVILLLSFGALTNAKLAEATLDADADGLDNAFEIKLGIDPESSDTDGDGLSDYDEYCKYRTDPKNKDSDGDGKPDSDWEERREYTYTMRAICEIRPPNDSKLMNDLYQDIRLVDKPGRLKDSAVVEVLLFPFSTPYIFAQPYPRKSIPKPLRQYVQPTLGMNFSEEMQKQVKEIIKGATTDVEVVEKILAWIANETRLENRIPEFAYFNVVDNNIVWRKSLGSAEEDQRLLRTNFFGDSMFKDRVHGTCSSMATLRATMLRAAGVPTRIIQNLPLINRYEGDPEPLVDRMRKRIMARGYEWGVGGGGANHVYNEVFLNNRWIRVDSVLNVGPFVGDKLFVKVYSLASWNDRLDWRNPRPPEDNWNENRDFRTLDVSDAYPKYESEIAQVIDLAIENKDLRVTKNPDGRFNALIRIYNKGSAPSPEFGVYFYAGDPDKGGRLLARHGAGPVMPGGNWGEYNPSLKLTPGENTIVVVIDPDNRVNESDEANNRASKEISASAEADNRPAKFKGNGLDIVVKDFRITFLPKYDAYYVVASIGNIGKRVSPEFGVYFYRGDPDHVEPMTHAAGPIEPGGVWRERSSNFGLKEGVNQISVVVDPDNSVAESDESNNRASLRVIIEKGQIVQQSVSYSSVKNTESEQSSKLPVDMVGTWFFDNPRGDDEQMAIFTDGNVVVLYSNGHKDQTRYADGFVKLAEYNNLRVKMVMKDNNTLLQYLNHNENEKSAKVWGRIDLIPHIDLLRSLN